MFNFVLSWTGNQNTVSDLIASEIAKAIVSGDPNAAQKIKKNIDTVKKIALWSTGKFFRLGFRKKFETLEPHRIHPLSGMSFTAQTRVNRPKIGTKFFRTSKAKRAIGGQFKRMIFAHVDPSNTDMQVGVLSGGANLPKKYIISEKWQANFMAFQQGGNLAFPGTSQKMRRYLRAINLPIKKTTILKNPARQVIKPFAESNPVQDIFEKKFLEKMKKKAQQ